MPTSTEPSATLRAGGLTFRPATLDDAEFASDVATARRPDDPEDPASTRYWWKSEDPEWTNDRYVVSHEHTAIGYARQSHAPWAKIERRYARVWAELLPRERTDERLGVVYDFIEVRARGDGAAILAAYAREDDPQLIAWTLARGYREERRNRAWELDIVANSERLENMAEESRAKMRAERIAILTLDHDPDPKKLEKIHEMTEEAASDVPRTIPRVRETFDVFRKWFDAPTVRADRMWIARQGEDIVGISALAYPPIRGNVWTDWTGTARKVRGRGVARALKLETVIQARALGVARVRTENDGANAPILHLNEEMGYVRIPGWIEFLKDLV